MCDATQKKIVSIYHPDSEFIVYNQNFWYSDKWDPLSYGRDFDFSKSFFEQFHELSKSVPRIALINIDAVNSEYCNMSCGNKNCYLICGGDFNQDCMYGSLPMHNTSCLDIDYSNDNTLCYEMSDSTNCYNCRFVTDSRNCQNSAFISDCISCTDCILCVNLVQKSYCIENVQYTKEDYFKLKQNLIDGIWDTQNKLVQKWQELKSSRTVKFSHQVNCQDCSGDYLKNSKNCQFSFDVSESEDLKNVIFAYRCKDCYDSDLLGEGTQLSHNTISTLGGYNCSFCYMIINCSNVEYSTYIHNSKNIFGCVGLKRNEYCIFNKQYSATEYETLKTKIIEHMKQTGEWGNYFPSYISDFGFNESSAHDYFPLSKDEALALGFKWQDQPQDRTADTSEDRILCLDCNCNFKIQKQESDFYTQNQIPVPRHCPNCRQKRRAKVRNPRFLWTRKCQCCNQQLQSSYAPNRPERVLCEGCYLNEVF